MQDKRDGIRFALTMTSDYVLKSGLSYIIKRSLLELCRSIKNWNLSDWDLVDTDRVYVSLDIKYES